MTCSHAFQDTSHCWKCGKHVNDIKAAGYDETLALLRAEVAAHADTRSALEERARDYSAELYARQSAEAECARLREKLQRVREVLSVEVRNARLVADEKTKLLSDTERRYNKVDAAMSHQAELAEKYYDLHAAEQRAHRATQRAWATYALTLRAVNADAGLPDPVAALVRQYAGHPVGKCDRCGKTAPLARKDRPAPKGIRGQEVPVTIEYVCAWGCEPDAPAEPTVLASSSAMVCTPEERAVLDAMAALDDSALRWLHKGTSLDIVTVVEAELARRAAKNGGNGG